MDLYNYNKRAWDASVERKDYFTLPATPAEIEDARNGYIPLTITGNRIIPKSWLADIAGKQVLCLAAGGGLQAPIMAAAGAIVTVFDSSPLQLAQDAEIARKHDLQIKIVEGDMKDLSCFNDEYFDYIIHPVANVFIDNVRPLWLEAYRVIKKGGVMIAGIANPILYIFDQEQLDKGRFIVRNKLPYSDLRDLPPKRLQYYKKKNIPLEFGHTLEQQLGGVCDVGFVIANLFEDDFDGEDLMDDYLKSLIVFRALKL